MTLAELGLGGRGAVVTVGAFDGVHRGHMAVLERNRTLAAARGWASLLVTFDPHPTEVLRPASSPPRLTPGREHLEALAEAGLDRLVRLRFDAQMAGRSAREFVDDALRGACGMQALVVGHDHGLGRGREGDVPALQAMGAALGFDVEVVAEARVAGELVSSSRVRTAVTAGDLGGAAALLGRPYRLTGVVVHGAGRGRTIGVPTINIAGVPARKLLPPDGVYAVRVETPSGCFGGMLNQGGKPTFGDDRRSLEAHLFDFAGDLYGASVRIEWVTLLRSTRRFASGEELRRQLAADRTQALAVLAATG